MTNLSTLPHASLLITHVAELLTCVPTAGDPAGRIRDGAIVYRRRAHRCGGTSAEVARQADTSSAQLIDARGKIVAPGFVDCHTHLVFGGSRVQEYAARMTLTPEQVQALGIPTGIIATVSMTRAANLETLCIDAAARVRRMFRAGTTTLESKSGYGLTLPDELKLLEVNRWLSGHQPVDVVSTFLGAHAFPTEMPRARISISSSRK